MPDQKTLTDTLQKLDEAAPRYTALTRYYEGVQPLTFLSPEAKEALNNRLAAVSVNVPRLLVNTIAERLRLTGFTREDVWSAWIANGMQAMSAVAHREALMLGDSYVIVWAGPDGSPRVTVESATQVAVNTDPATRQVVSGVKRWEADGATHAVWYGADEIVRYRANGLGATTTGFEAVETIPNPLGRTPLVHLRNGDRLLGPGLSEMNDVLSLTDAIVKLTTDMLTASEYAARPRRWASGVELAEDDEGNAVNPFGEDDRMMVSEAPESKFGQLPAADLAGYENATGIVMRQISAVSGLPEHLLGIGGDNPTSADSIRASEAALTAKAEARQGTFGQAWREVAQLMVAVRDGVDPAGVDVEPVWADPSTRSAAQEADAITKLFTAGLIPATAALRRLGYTQPEIDAIRTDRRAEALDQAGVNITELLP